MKLLYFVLILVILSTSFSVFFFNHNALYVIGGSYVLKTGQVLDGDLNVLFAQVTLEDGSRVGGDVLAVGSDLEAIGTVEGSISSRDVFGYTILVPELHRFQVAR